MCLKLPHYKSAGLITLLLGSGGLTALIFIILTKILPSVKSLKELQFSTILLVSLSLILSLLNIAGGIGCLKHTERGRITIVALAAIYIFLIPVGTAIGIYLLWALVNHWDIPKEEAKELGVV